jgi:hypothetical protein
MKLISLILILFLFNQYFCQEEGQNFCDEFTSQEYFPLDIEKKKLLWSSTYYFEKITNWKTINEKEYVEFIQEWEDGKIDTLYLREKDGIVYQFDECCDNESIRFNSSFKKGDSWQTADKKATNTIITFKGKLKTPYCEYKNLLIIESQFTKSTFKFYYKKGYGYIAAMIDGKLISYATPKW